MGEPPEEASSRPAATWRRPEHAWHGAARLVAASAVFLASWVNPRKWLGKVIRKLCRAVIHGPCDALKAEAFENPAKVAGKPVVQVEISNLAKAQLPFQHFELSLKRGRPAA